MNTKQTVLFGVLALLGGLIGGILSERLPGKADAKSNVQKVVKAEKFVLVDDRGRHRGSFSTVGEATIFEITREEFNSNLRMLAGPDHASLSIHTQNSNGIYMMSGKDALRIDITGKLLPQDRHPTLPTKIPSMIQIALDSNGYPTLQLNDYKDRPRIILGKTELKNTKTGSTEIRSTGSIVIFDEKGKVMYKVP